MTCAWDDQSPSTVWDNVAIAWDTYCLEQPWGQRNLQETFYIYRKPAAQDFQLGSPIWQYISPPPPIAQYDWPTPIRVKSHQDFIQSIPVPLLYSTLKPFAQYNWPNPIWKRYTIQDWIYAQAYMPPPIPPLPPVKRTWTPDDPPARPPWGSDQLAGGNWAPDQSTQRDWQKEAGPENTWNKQSPLLPPNWTPEDPDP
jgi:hypothetical protein